MSDPKSPSPAQTQKQPTPDELAETQAAENPQMADTNAGDPPQSAVNKPQSASQASTTKSPKSPKKVTQLGDFKLLKKLGRGGMGVVYLARQVSLDREVALKTLSQELAKNETCVKRFLRESRSMAKLQHPNVVQVYAADSFRDVHYAAIEYIDGQSMQDWLNANKRLSIGDALHVILVCAEALAHAHELSIVHRDIKPDNILVTKKGVVKVADFGLAKVVDEDVSMTQSGAGLGTPLYMAPEQARQAKHVDARCDIYALGVTLYHFLTGKLPFTGDTALELVIAKERGVFESARKLVPEIPERLDLILDKMTAKLPQHRYANCQDLIADIAALDLDGDHLSFIDGAVSPTLRRGSGPRTRAGSGSSQTKVAMPRSSAEDAARQQKSPDVHDPNFRWYVQHTNPAGRVVVSRYSTDQIRKAIKKELLEVHAKARKSPDDRFLPLAQFAEFEAIMHQRVVKERTDKRGRDMKSMYEQLDKAEQRRKKWRWLRNFGQNLKGSVGLIIWLALIAGAIFAAYKWGYPWVMGFFEN